LIEVARVDLGGAAIGFVGGKEALHRSLLSLCHGAGGGAGPISMPGGGGIGPPQEGHWLIQFL